MFINKASNQLEGLKELEESNVLDIDYNEMDSDPLFKVEKSLITKLMIRVNLCSTFSATN